MKPVLAFHTELPESQREKRIRDRQCGSESFSRRRVALSSSNGSASALIILVLTVLILLGVLSLVTVASDLRLATRRANWQKQWFETDEKAVHWLAALDQKWHSLLADHPEKSGLALADAVAVDLTEWLELQGVLDPEITVESDGLIVSAQIGLRVPPEPSDQMLNLSVWFDTDRTSVSFGHLNIVKWAQWQVSPVVPEESGVIWIPSE